MTDRQLPADHAAHGRGPRRAPVPFSHIGLTVPDLDAATRWYVDVLGWELLMGPIDVSTDNPKTAGQLRDVFGADRVSFRQAHLHVREGVAVELFEFSEPERTDGTAEFDYWNPGLFHICVVEPNIEELAARIASAGGLQRTTVRAIFPDEPYRFCYCEDPFGNIIEIATHPHAAAFGGRQSY